MYVILPIIIILSLISYNLYLARCNQVYSFVMYLLKAEQMFFDDHIKNIKVETLDKFEKEMQLLHKETEKFSQMRLIFKFHNPTLENTFSKKFVELIKPYWNQIKD